MACTPKGTGPVSEKKTPVFVDNGAAVTATWAGVRGGGGDYFGIFFPFSKKLMSLKTIKGPFRSPPFAAWGTAGTGGPVSFLGHDKGFLAAGRRPWGTRPTGESFDFVGPPTPFPIPAAFAALIFRFPGAGSFVLNENRFFTRQGTTPPRLRLARFVVRQLGLLGSGVSLQPTAGPASGRIFFGFFFPFDPVEDLESVFWTHGTVGISIGASRFSFCGLFIYRKPKGGKGGGGVGCGVGKGLGAAAQGSSFLGGGGPRLFLWSGWGVHGSAPPAFPQPPLTWLLGSFSFPVAGRGGAWAEGVLLPRGSMVGSHFGRTNHGETGKSTRFAGHVAGTSPGVSNGRAPMFLGAGKRRPGGAIDGPPHPTHWGWRVPGFFLYPSAGRGGEGGKIRAFGAVFPSGLRCWREGRAGGNPAWAKSENNVVELRFRPRKEKSKGFTGRRNRRPAFYMGPFSNPPPTAPGS